MIDAEAVRKLFDENIDDHRKYYKLGFQYWHRGEGSGLGGLIALGLGLSLMKRRKRSRS